MKYLSSLLFVACFASVGVSAANAAGNTSKDGLMLGSAMIQYQVAAADKEVAFAGLAGEAHAFSLANPAAAEPLIMEGMIVSSYASVVWGGGAIALMEQARDALLAAIKIDPAALDGAAFSLLGHLYYTMPDWPVGFGDNPTAFNFLQKALKLSPDNMDANYFMGDFLLKDLEYQEAVIYLQKVVNMPDIPTRPIYSQGRKAEASAKLAQAMKNL